MLNGTLSSVQRFSDRRTQPLDFVLHHQFATLQVNNHDVVGGRMHQRVVDLMFESRVLPFELGKMSFNRHWRGPPSDCSGRWIVHESSEVSMLLSNDAAMRRHQFSAGQRTPAVHPCTKRTTAK